MSDIFTMTLSVSWDNLNAEAYAITHTFAYPFLSRNTVSGQITHVSPHTFAYPFLSRNTVSGPITHVSPHTFAYPFLSRNIVSGPITHVSPQTLPTLSCHVILFQDQ